MKKTIVIWSIIVLVFLSLISGIFLVYQLLELSDLSGEDQIVTADRQTHTVVPEKKSSKEVESSVPDVSESRNIQVSLPEELEYKNGYIDLPLQAEDFYYGKYINAKIAVKELNRMPALEPGDRVEIIKDGYLTMDETEGYIKPGGGFHYASGVCWTVSTFGAIMDEANEDFEKVYGVPLFVYENLDRIPHKKSYKTYAKSNGGYGYTVSIDPSGYVFDYNFIVNPEIADIPELEGFKVDIVLRAVENHRLAYNGEAIEGYVLTNANF